MNGIGEAIPITGNISLPSECVKEFKKAMKIGYYKSFFNKGIINASQLEKLIKMQNEAE